MNSEKQWRILQADFALAAPNYAALPESELLEAALVGRSNVGKSSLLNAICARKALARTSKTPGRTQLFNYFTLRYADLDPDGERISEHYGHLVDLPGYGYARSGKAMRRSWQKLIEQYLLSRNKLALVCLLIDIRREPGEEEKWIAELGKQGGMQILLTKCDKISKNDHGKRRQAIAKALGADPKTLLPVSTVGKKSQGLQQVISTVCASLSAPD